MRDGILLEIDSPWAEKKSLYSAAIIIFLRIIIPSDGVDRDSSGESGHLLKMSFLALGSL